MDKHKDTGHKSLIEQVKQNFLKKKLTEAIDPKKMKSIKIKVKF